MITYQDLTTKTARQLIQETESVDEVLDAIIREMVALKERVDALEAK